MWRQCRPDPEEGDGTSQIQRREMAPVRSRWREAIAEETREVEGGQRRRKGQRGYGPWVGTWETGTEDCRHRI